MKNKQTLLQEAIGYRFSDPHLLSVALTHSSWLNETDEPEECNERLEFLGDAVLELLSSDYLYHEHPEEPEGELSKLRASLVCEPTLAQDAEAIRLGDYLRMGKGEEATGGRMRPSVTSDAMEALLGAIYLDGGLAAAKAFVMRFILNDIEEKRLFYDAKTILQAEVQKRTGELPDYRITGMTGPEHDRSFTAEVWSKDACLGTGCGRSKKAAEQKAAYEALKRMKAE